MAVHHNNLDVVKLLVSKGGSAHSTARVRCVHVCVFVYAHTQAGRANTAHQPVTNTQIETRQKDWVMLTYALIYMTVFDF